MKKQGYLALANNNLTIPAIAMGTNGKGAIAFTALGGTTTRAQATRRSTLAVLLDRSTSPQPDSAPTTASPATRRSLVIPPDRAGATMARP